MDNTKMTLGSLFDGIGMGIGFTAALFVMSLFREFLGNGTLFADAQNLLSVFGDNVLGGWNGWTVLSTPMTVFILPAGGFFVFGVLIALSNKLGEKKNAKKVKKIETKGFLSKTIVNS